MNIGDRVKVVDIVVPEVTKNKEFYEKFRGEEGVIVDYRPNIVGLFPYKVKLDRYGIQPFCEKELEKIG